MAVVVVVGLFSACGGEEPTGPADLADPVLSGTDTTAVQGTRIAVTVPNGAYTVTVTEPTSDLPADVETTQDPGETEYVGIAWQPRGDAPEFGPVLQGTEPETARVTLREGSTTLDVATLGPSDQGGTANGVVWAAVGEDAEPLLDVDYDGLTQTFDLATGERAGGPADGFYDDSTPTLTGTCPDQGPGRTGDGLQYTVTCALSPVASVPYVAGLGWVPESGTTYLVWELGLTPTTFRRPVAGEVATYRVEDTTTTVEVAGGEAEVLEESETPQGGWTAGLAALVPVSETTSGATLDVDRRLTLLRDDGPSGAPADDEAVISFSVELD